MMELLDAETLPALAGAVLPALFDLTLKGMLILAFAGLLAALLRRSSAAARHLVWSLAICGVLLLPLFALTLPAWPVAALSSLPYPGEAAGVFGGPPAPVEAAAVADVPADAAEMTPVAAPTPDAAAEAPPGTRATRPVAVHEAMLGAFAWLFETARALPWTAWLLLVWLGGVAVVLLRWLVGAAGVRWLAYRARPVADPAWRRLAVEVSGSLRLRRRVRLLRSLRTAMPMTWGLARPVVLLPVSAHGWSEARRRCVLLHECAHVKRWDCLTQALAQVVCAVYWFNPLVWIAARRMRQEREMACDDYVLAGGVRPTDYATHLLAIARTTRSTLVAPLSAVAMARPSQLEGRVVSILDAARKRHAVRRAVALAGVLLAAALVLPLAAMRPADPTLEGAGTDEDRLVFRPVATSNGRAFRWTGEVARGKTVEIRNIRGDVYAAPASGRAVEVFALYQDGARQAGHLLVMEHAGGLTLCPADPSNPATCACASDVAPSHRPDAVAFHVRLPEGVHFAGYSLEGDIRAKGLRGNLKAESVDGDIDAEATGVIRAASTDGDIALRTDAYGQAHTIDGDINVRLGRTDWAGTLAFSSVDGNVAVALPAEAHTDIDLHVEADGQLHSAIQLQRRLRTGEARFRGTLGRGGRLLALHTVDGNITIMHAGGQERRAEERIAVRMQEPAPEPKRSPYRADAVARLAADLEPLRLPVGGLDGGLSADVLDVARRVAGKLNLDVALNGQDMEAWLARLTHHEAFVETMRRLGFEEVADETLVVAHLFGVDPGYVRLVREAGYCPPLVDLVKMKVAGIDGAFLEEMQAEGYARLPVEKLLALRKSREGRTVIRALEKQAVYAPRVEEGVHDKTSRGPNAHHDPGLR